MKHIHPHTPQYERWYVFYSERQQRDYYYEPITGRTQWAIPHHHPHHRYDNRQAPRRVRFSMDLQDTSRVSNNNGIPNDSKSLIKIFLGLAILFLLMMVVPLNVNMEKIAPSSIPISCMEDLKDGKDDGQFQIIVAMDDMDPIQNMTKDQDQNEPMLEKEDFQMTQLRHCLLEESQPPHDCLLLFPPTESHSSTRKEQVEEMEEIPADKSIHKLQIPSLIPNPSPPFSIQTLTMAMALFLQEEPHYWKTKDVSKKTLPHSIKTSKRRSTNACDIPFAYLFSVKCRTQSTEMPLFDVENFLQYMLQ